MKTNLNKAIVYSQDGCPGCVTAKTLLVIAGYDVEERKLGNGWTKEDLLKDVPNVRSVPQVLINGVHIGGLAEVRNLL
jgi:glutaredoxin